jgi:hypothetical protein
VDLKMVFQKQHEIWNCLWGRIAVYRTVGALFAEKPYTHTIYIYYIYTYTYYMYTFVSVSAHLTNLVWVITKISTPQFNIST